jgi:antitoxin VapB
MAFSIKHDEADALAREPTAITGDSLTMAVTVALRERLDRCRLQTASKSDGVAAAVAAIRALPVLNDVTEADILRWDDIGLPA